MDWWVNESVDGLRINRWTEWCMNEFIQWNNERGTKLKEKSEKMLVATGNWTQGHWLKPPLLSPLSYDNHIIISTSQSSIYCMSGAECFSHTLALVRALVAEVSGPGFNSQWLQACFHFLLSALFLAFVFNVRQDQQRMEQWMRDGWIDNHGCL